MEPKIIFQDEYILLINKPSGWIVNDAQTAKGQSIIQVWIRENFDFPTSNSFEYRSGIVHRIDKETSGVLIIAKTKEAMADIQGQFKERLVKKSYIALVHGELNSTEGNIDVPVGRLPWRRDRFGVLPGGRPAQTSYSVEKVYEGGNKEKYSLVKCFPRTGRTHQIRIHMKHIGHPLVADEFYAGRKTARNDRKWCPRLFLHAATIQFKHPVNGKIVEFNADLPEDLASVLSSLQPVTPNLH